MPKPSCSVYVGNLPFDATESQLLEILKTVGPVVKFTPIVDRETAKPKGYGFCRYRDEQTAAAAIRNLNGHDFNGRPLKLDYAAEGLDMKAQEGGGGRRWVSREHKKSYSSSGGVRKQPTIGANMKVKVPTPSSTEDVISDILKNLSKEQQLEILTEMKRLVNQSPESAEQLLKENPQLAQTLLHLQVLFGLVRSNDIQDVQSSQAGYRDIGGPTHHGGLGGPSGPPNRGGPGYQPMQQPPPPQQQFGGLRQFGGPPPPQSGHPIPPRGGPYHPGPPPPPPSQQRFPQAPPPSRPGSSQLPLGALPAKEQQVLQEVLRMSPEQIKALPPEFQAQIYTLQQQMTQR